jgi:DNA-binding ferritin-like protein (Dps family)
MQYSDSRKKEFKHMEYQLELLREKSYSNYARIGDSLYELGAYDNCHSNV